MATSDDLRKASPYFDDFDPSKQYSHILAVPGRVEQAREFTQIQTLLFHYLKKLSDTLFKDGNIVSGMSFSISGNTLTVEAGKVYVSGKIHEFKKQSITITKNGREIIGVKLNESVVTEVQDTSLLDPSLNMGNYSMPGAHRIKSEPVLTLNDTSSPTIFELQDGALVVEVSKPGFDGITDVLAKRTYDESGNYRVSGMEVNAQPYDANNVQLIVEAGNSYVMGYQVMKPTPVKIILPMSKNIKSVINEPKTYVTGTTKYALNNFPSKAITQVSATVETTATLTRGTTPNGIDFLPKTPVVSIQTVTAGATTYVQGTDYQLTSDGVSWALSGAEPSVGSSYTVTYRYSATLVSGTDYTLYQEDGAFGTTKDYLKFTTSGTKPVNNTTVNINYDYYLARIDLVSLDRYGNITVTTGQSDIPRLVTPPVFNDPQQLVLGTVYLPPNAGNATAKSTVVTRMDMSQLQRMSKRLDDVEYNQAITALDQEAISGELPTDLKGVFSDSFRTSEKGDLTHSAFDIMYSVEDGVIMLPFTNTKTNTPVIDSANTTTKQWNRLITAPYTEKVAINQPYGTTTMKVNPYLAFNSLALLKLSPEVDNWIETEYIEIDKVEFKARNYYKWWYHPKDSWMKDNVKDLLDLPLDGGGTVNDWRPPAGLTHEQITVTKTEKSTSVLKEAITYMRQIDVKITASNLEPSTDNLECYFDGVKVSLTPAAGYSAGANAGTLRANTSGTASGTFTIPSGIRTGTREVVLKNGSNTSSAPFTAIGTKETTVDTITRTRITLTAVDPLAQTFQFDNDTFLSSIGVYFSAKDNTNNVMVQIRNVVNGYPGNVIYAEKYLTPSQVNVSADATLETKITFDDPVVCTANTQYCVVYLVNSSTHAMYVSDLGQKDITTGQLVTQEPYLAGMLFSSSNGITWTAHQSMNLKFKAYACSFSTSSKVQFNPISGLGIDKILLMADYLTPQNTGCVWEVSLDDGAFQSISSQEDKDTNKVVNKVVLRATITTSNTSVSPIIAKDSLVLVGFVSATTGAYVSRMTPMEQDVTNVKQVFDAYIPSGCTITPQFTLDDGTTWLTPTQTSAVPVSADWTRYTFEKAVSLPNKRSFRARINITAQSALARPRVRKFMNIIK